MKKVLLPLLLTIACVLPAHAQVGMERQVHRDGHEQMMAQGTMDRMGDMMGACLEHAADLGLSDDQVAKLAPVHRAMQKKQVQYKADLKIAEIDLMEIMEVKDFNVDLAVGQVQKIEQIKAAHHVEMLKSIKDVRSLLTDEQFKKMKKMMLVKRDGKRPDKKQMHQKGHK